MARAVFTTTPIGVSFVVAFSAFLLTPVVILLFRLIRLPARHRSLSAAVAGEVTAVVASPGRVKVTYRYDFEGLRYSGNESGPVDFLDPARIFVSISTKSVVDRYKTCLAQGVPVRVWVNPAAPNQSTLSKEVGWVQCIALVMLLVGYGFVMAVLPQLIDAQINPFIAALVGIPGFAAGLYFFHRRTTSPITERNPV